MSVSGFLMENLGVISPRTRVKEDGFFSSAASQLIVYLIGLLLGASVLSQVLIVPRLPLGSVNCSGIVNAFSPNLGHATTFTRRCWRRIDLAQEGTVALRRFGRTSAKSPNDFARILRVAAFTGVRVDPARRTVRVGPGCVTGDVDHATHTFGQAVPFGIISTTGVAGLTLSGGHGYLGRQYGLACDCLIEADVVLADGSFVTASEEDNPDLLWALRGGCGNFGVVTSFLFRTHPAKTLYGGPIIFDLSDAAAVMRW